MAEANDHISFTEPALPGAMAWIWRTASELGLGAVGSDSQAGIRRLGSRELDLEISGSIGGFFLFSSLLFTSFGSRPSTNSVGTGFYHLPLEVEFPRTPDPPKGHP